MTPWIIDRCEYGSHVVRLRATKEVTGGIVPFKGCGYLARRAEGGEMEWPTRFDAAYWIMQGYEKTL